MPLGSFLNKDCEVEENKYVSISLKTEDILPLTLTLLELTERLDGAAKRLFGNKNDIIIYIYIYIYMLPYIIN
ncbi:MAG: hypothetical protein Ta2D_05260 [Rickettsiales bacterium]|nr:MAG: hypothetical protein Ta2D_05260 [Rickettsiales bacterium]